MQISQSLRFCSKRLGRLSCGWTWQPKQWLLFPWKFSGDSIHQNHTFDLLTIPSKWKQTLSENRTLKRISCSPAAQVGNWSHLTLSLSERLFTAAILYGRFSNTFKVLFVPSDEIFHTLELRSLLICQGCLHSFRRPHIWSMQTLPSHSPSSSNFLKKHSIVFLSGAHQVRKIVHSLLVWW